SPVPTAPASSKSTNTPRPVPCGAGKNGALQSRPEKAPPECPPPRRGAPSRIPDKKSPAAWDMDKRSWPLLLAILLLAICAEYTQCPAARFPTEPLPFRQVSDRLDSYLHGVPRSPALLLHLFGCL